jgi:hypothetical protein
MGFTCAYIAHAIALRDCICDILSRGDDVTQAERRM